MSFLVACHAYQGETSMKKKTTEDTWEVSHDDAATIGNPKPGIVRNYQE